MWNNDPECNGHIQSATFWFNNIRYVVIFIGDHCVLFIYVLMLIVRLHVMSIE